MDVTKTNLPENPEPTHSESSAVRNAPRLSTKTLTVMLACMCAVPAIIILTLTKLMPPTAEGKLEAAVTRVGVPTEIAYYEVEDLGERADVSEASLLIKNNSDSEWQHIVIKVNKQYDIKDHTNPIPPGAERSYLLNRCVSRTGARFDLRQLPLHHVRVYAKQVDKGNRASFNVEYPDMIKSRGIWVVVFAVLFVIGVFSIAGMIWYGIWRRETKAAAES